jgi:hypothetical protein
MDSNWQIIDMSAIRLDQGEALYLTSLASVLKKLQVGKWESRGPFVEQAGDRNRAHGDSMGKFCRIRLLPIWLSLVVLRI